MQLFHINKQRKDLKKMKKRSIFAEDKRCPGIGNKLPTHQACIIFASDLHNPCSRF